VAQPPSAEPTATPSVPPEEGAAPPAETVAPVPTATPGETPAPEGTLPNDGSGPDPGSAEAEQAGGLATWPAGERAWTVVIASTTSRAEAEKKAEEAGGGDVGVLKSDDYSSLRKGYWVVFAGQYPSQSAAQTAAEGRGGGAYARRVVPR
jgi:hypothetical protein